MKNLAYSFTLMVLFSCTSYPETPEKVIEQYVEYMSTGNCEKAIELCYGPAQDLVRAEIQSGCDVYDVEIDSIQCKIVNTICNCVCYEDHEIFGIMAIPDNLQLVNEQWRLLVRPKNSY